MPSSRRRAAARASRSLARRRALRRARVAPSMSPTSRAQLDVARLPEPGERRQVVRVRRRQRERRVASARLEVAALLALEVEHLRRQHAPLLERRRHLRGTVPRSSPTTSASCRTLSSARMPSRSSAGSARTRPPAPSRPRESRTAGRDPSRDRCAARRRGESRCARAGCSSDSRSARSARGSIGGSPQFCPVAEYGIRRRADARAAGRTARVRPGVGARRRRADREILVEPDRHPGFARASATDAELAVELELEPAMKVDARRVLALRTASRRRRRASCSAAGHSRQFHDPCDSAIATKVANCVSSGSSPRDELAYARRTGARPRSARASTNTRCSASRIGHLERHHLLVVDRVDLAERAQLARRTPAMTMRGGDVRRAAQLRDRLDVDVQRVAEERLTGLYGLMSSPRSRSACSGFTPTNAPPTRQPTRRASRDR